jgi:hypothetical protein
MMASSICSRSCRSSTSILVTSIQHLSACKMYLQGRPLFRNQNSTTHFLIVTLVVVQHPETFFNSLVLKTEQNPYRTPWQPAAKVAVRASGTGTNSRTGKPLKTIHRPPRKLRATKAASAARVSVR